MSQAMKRIVDMLVKTQNVSALRELQAHRQMLIRGLEDLKNFDNEAPIRQNREELHIIEDAISALTAPAGREDHE